MGIDGIEHIQDDPEPQTTPRPNEIVDLGPEMFTNGDVISYKGENYYRACGDLVRISDEGTTRCVKRVGHPGYLHEDYDGAVAGREIHGGL